MDYIYVQIKNGVVYNSLVLKNLSLEPLFTQDYDYLIRVDEMSPMPGMRWTYDGTNFYPPPEPPVEQDDEEQDGDDG